MTTPDVPTPTQVLADVGMATLLYAGLIGYLDACTTADLLMHAQLGAASRAAEYPALVAQLTAEIDRRLAAMGAPVEGTPA